MVQRVHNLLRTSKRRIAMKAKEIMTRPVLATTARASGRDIAAKLVGSRITGMPVADRTGTVVGVITEADILEALLAGKKLESLIAEDIMSKDPVTADVDLTMADVMKLLNDEGVLRVPVTERGVLVGVISRGDIIKATLEPEFLSFE
jgi:CBS domain-containing protein